MRMSIRMSPQPEGAMKPDEKTGRSEKEQRDFMREAAYIVRLFAPHHLDVVPDVEKKWTCGMSESYERARLLEDYLEGRIDIENLPDNLFRPDQLTYDPESIRTYPRGVLHGLIRHEVGHAKHSDYRNTWKGTRRVLKEDSLPSTFVKGMNSLEDGWMENRECNESLTGKRQLDECVSYSIPESIEVLRTGMVPRFMQLGLRILYQNALGRGLITQSQIDELEAHGFRKEVVKAFDRIHDYVEKYLDPAQSTDANYELYTNHIWPEFKRFEERNIDDNMLNELLNPQGAAGKKLARKFGKNLRRILKKELKKHQKEIERQLGDLGGDGEKPEDSGIKGVIQRLKKKLLGDKEPSPGESRGEKDPKGDTPGKITKMTREKIKKILKEAQKDISRVKLTPEQTKAVEKELKRLEKESPELAKQVREAAKKALDKKQAKDLKGSLPAGVELEEDKDGVFKPKLKPGDPKNVQDQKKKLKEFSKKDDQDQFAEREDIMKQIGQAKTPEEVDELKKGLELPPNHRDEIKDAIDRKKEHLEEERRQREIEMEKLGFDPEEVELYEEYMNIEREVRRDFPWYKRELAKILPKKKDITYDGYYYSGPKIKDKKGMVRKIVTGRGNFYQRPDLVEVPKPKLFFVQLIDRSGSMQEGIKMRETLKTAILFNLLSKEFDIHNSIIFYDDEVEEVKTLMEDFDAPERKIKAKFMRASKKKGATDIGLATDHAVKELDALRRRFSDMGGILLPITDGVSTSGEDSAVTKEKIETLKKRFPVIALYLAGENVDSEDLSSIEDLFGSRESGGTVAVEDFAELRQHAFSAFKKAAQFLMRRYQ